MGATTLSLMSAIVPSDSDQVNYAHAKRGVHVVDDTATHSVAFYTIVVIAEAVISTITALGVSGASLDGKTLPVGTHPIHGTALTLTSGVVYLLRA